MSKVAIQGNATGTGVFTIASPATNTDRTLTLPDEAGTVLTNSSDIPAANLTGSLPAGMGGKLLQVVSNVGTAISVSTGTPTVVVQSSITVVANSRVLAFACGDMNPTDTGNWHYFQIYRDSSAVGQIYIGQTAAGSYNLPFSIVTFDTALSAGTYTYSLRVNQGSGSITYGEIGNQQAPTIVLMEVAA